MNITINTEKARGPLKILSAGHMWPRLSMQVQVVYMKAVPKKWKREKRYLI